MNLKVFYFHIVAVLILNFNLILHANQNETTYTKLVDKAFTFSNFNYIFEIKEENEYIWAATLGGVVKFDKNGNVIKCYTTSDGLIDNYVRSLNIDNEGNKWFSGWGVGISMLDGKNWKTYNEHNTKIHDIYKVQSITINNDGSKLFSLYTWPAKIAVLKNDSWSILQPENIGSVYDVVPDIFNKLWIATSSGVYKHNGSKWERLSRDSVTAIELDSITGSLWVSCDSYDSFGVSKYNGTSWTNFTESDGLISNSISCIAIENNGVKWFGSSSGVSKFDEVNNKWATYTQVKNIKIEDVNDIVVDSEGNKWFGTNTGIIKFDNTSWESYTMNNSSPIYFPSDAAEDNNGNIWVTHHNSTYTKSYLSMYDGSEWKLIKQSNDQIWFALISIDKKGKLWFHSSNKIVSYDRSEWQVFSSANGLSFNSINDLTIDLDDNIWVASSIGISMYNGNYWVTFNSSSDGLNTEFNGVGRIEVDTNGSLWFLNTTYGSNFVRFAFYEYNNQKWNKSTNYDYNDCNSLAWVDFRIDNDNTKWIVGFSRNSKIQLFFDGINWGIFDTPYNISDIEIDNSGKKWFGTFENGIVKLDGTKWTVYNTSCGLTSNNISPLVFLSTGELLAISGWGNAISQLISLPFPKADINEDGNIGLQDMLTVTNLLSYKIPKKKSLSIKSDVNNKVPDINYIGSDINNNNKIDQAEMIFVLKSISENTHKQAHRLISSVLFN